MAPTCETFSTRDGIRLSVTRWGSAGRPAVVLLHGGGANSRWWTPLAEALEDSFTLYALDFRGHGDSEFPAALRVGAFLLDLESFVAEYQLEHIGLIGHSMGAHVALDFSARQPSVWGLVAIEAARGASKTDNRRARLALAARRTHKTRAEAVARFRFLPESSLGVPEPIRVTIAEHSVREEPDGRFGYKFDPRWFRLQRLAPAPRAQIEAPTLVVRGSESPLLTREGAKQLVAEIPRARLVEIEGAVHNPHLERCDETARAIRDHFDSTSAGKPHPGAATKRRGACADDAT